jgi:hypothetical protein
VTGQKTDAKSLTVLIAQAMKPHQDAVIGSLMRISSSRHSI